MLRGEPIWHTSSTGPMSMPELERGGGDERREVARPAAAPRARSRRSFERLPWWAATRPSPSRSASRCASRSASRRVFTKTSVVRCARDVRRRCGRGSRPTARGTATASSSLSGSSIARSSARAVAEVDDAAGGAAVGPLRSGPAPTRSRAIGLDRPLGGREPDALGPPVGERLQPLEREREVRAALVAGDGVDLVHDHGAHAPEPLAAPLGGDEQVERLGRGDQEVRGLPEHGRARGRGRVAGADDRAELGHRRGRAPARSRGSPPAGARGSPGCRRRAPSAARRRRPRSGGPRRGRPAAARNSRSMPTRKAASVLPEPVGAAISVSSPLRIAGQPGLLGLGRPAGGSAARTRRGRRGGSR